MLTVPCNVLEKDEIQLVLFAFKPDVTIYCAGLSGLNDCAKADSLADSLNTMGLFNVADLDFHNSVVKGSQNDILGAFYDALSNLMLESRRRTNKIPGVAKGSLEDHQRIFLAIKSGNRDLAHRTMFTHIEEVGQNMKKMFT